MNDLIIPPEPPQPKKIDAPSKVPVEIVIDRRGRRPLRYGLIAAFIGLAGVAATHFYPADSSKGTAPRKAEAQAPQQVAAPALDEATKRRVAALQDQVQELRTKLDAVEKRQQAERASAPPPAAVPKTPAESPAAEASVTQHASEKPDAKPARAAKSNAAKTDVAKTDAAKNENAKNESVKSASAKNEAASVQAVPPAPRVVSGYRVRDVYHGAALIESARGMIGVEPGEFVPGVGRVIAIQERGGRWVVITESGEISGNARGPSHAQAPRRRQFARELDGFMPGPFAPPLFPPY
ncbi:MAG: hypothetical protein AB7F41_06980 [Methylocystis sp.]|uniref:hypothetical protein n=1 Tax=Methylocystis sp. TaxID=1911079 RepID=UPI003D0D2313